MTAAIDRAIADETTARRRAHPGPGGTPAHRAPVPDPGSGNDGVLTTTPLELRLGLGTVSSAVEVRTNDGPAGTETVDHPVLVDVPVTVALAEAGVLGLAGAAQPGPAPGPFAGRAARRLAQPPAPRPGPAPRPSPTRDWEWARWLPHLRPGPGGGPLRVGVDGAQLRARVDELVAVLDARAAVRSPGGRDRTWAGPTTVVVLDGAGALRRHARRGAAARRRTGCRAAAALPRPRPGVAAGRVPGHGRGHRRGRDPAARRPARRHDVRRRGRGRGRRRWGAPVRPGPRSAARRDPGRPAVRAAGGRPAARPAGVRRDRPRRRWRPRGGSARAAPGSCSASARTASRSSSTSPPTARTPWSPGPPASGKSELLQTLVAGLALANRPDEMSFVLVDYKGGAAFRDCARLPHTVGTVTDLDGHLTERALRSLGAELRRRETVLRSAGCKDLDDYLATAPAGSPPLARLVLVVDEFATLVEELPDFVGGLVGIAQRGRSLGVHLVLATQRPGGVVSADIRANTSLRIALRVTDPAESTDVVDVRDAADIPRAPPPAARCSASVPARCAALQSARVGGHGESGRPRSRACPRRGSGPATPVRRPPADEAGPARPTSPGWSTRPAGSPRIGAAPVASPWLPPLPGWSRRDREPARRPTSSRARTARSRRASEDLPGEQRRDPVTFGLARRRPPAGRRQRPQRPLHDAADAGRQPRRACDSHGPASLRAGRRRWRAGAAGSPAALRCRRGPRRDRTRRPAAPPAGRGARAPAAAAGDGRPGSHEEQRRSGRAGRPAALDRPAGRRLGRAHRGLRVGRPWPAARPLSAWSGRAPRSASASC